MDSTRLHPRRDHQVVEIGGRVVWIRDQKPLHAGNIAFEEGWDMPRLLAHIDSHVFFWPGTERGPIEAGLSHFARYESERPALLRIRTRELFEVNPHLQPLFCRFNSGAPRSNPLTGKPLRGASTYLQCAHIDATAGGVQEVVFDRAIRLPLNTEVATSYAGPWSRLFERW